MTLEKRRWVAAGVLSALVLAWNGLWPFAVLCLLIATHKMRQPEYDSVSDAFGSAELASQSTLKQAGMLGESGLILGRVGDRLLRIPASAVTHLLTVGPSGCGKFVSVLAANLLAGWVHGSLFLFDPKFEALKVTSARRKALGQEIVVLDPLQASGYPSAKFNPLAHLDPNSPRLIEDTRALGNAVVVRRPQGEVEGHWTNMAEDVITAFMTFVVWKAPPHQRNLQTVVDLLSNEETYHGTLKLMQQAGNACGGMLERMGNQIARLQDKELASVLSTCFEHLSFLNSPLVKAHTVCTAADSFDPRRMLNGKVSVFFGLPADQLRPLGRLARLEITAILRTFMRAGPDSSRSCLMALDETVQLGSLPILEDAVTLLRGYGVKTWTFFQSTGQISEVFPENKAKTFMSNMDVVQYFTPNDYPTAEEISKRLGDETRRIINYSGGTGGSKSHSDSLQGVSNSGGTSWNDNWSTQELGRALLKPDEVLRLGPNAKIIFCRHVPPILASLVRYYQDPEFTGRGRILRRRKKRGRASLAEVCIVLVLFVIFTILVFAGVL